MLSMTVAVSMMDWRYLAVSSIASLLNYFGHAQVPSVLKRELYVVAAIVGALVVMVWHALGLSNAPVEMVGAGLCFALRATASCQDWRLLLAGGDNAT